MSKSELIELQLVQISTFYVQQFPRCKQPAENLNFLTVSNIFLSDRNQRLAPSRSIVRWRNYIRMAKLFHQLIVSSISHVVRHDVTFSERAVSDWLNDLGFAKDYCALQTIRLSKRI